MKTLQNNFTTPEQSKRLLELGVPADSADCVWYNPYYDGDRPELAEISVWKGKYPQRVDKYTLPCWSVGRLLEIFLICTSIQYDMFVPIISPLGKKFPGMDGYRELLKNNRVIDSIIEEIETLKQKYLIDFSKLEE